MRTRQSTVIAVPAVEESRKKLDFLGKQIAHAELRYSQILADIEKSAKLVADIETLNTEIIRKQAIVKTLDESKRADDAFTKKVKEVTKKLNDREEIIDRKAQIVQENLKECLRDKTTLLENIKKLKPELKAKNDALALVVEAIKKAKDTEEKQKDDFLKLDSRKIVLGKEILEVEERLKQLKDVLRTHGLKVSSLIAKKKLLIDDLKDLEDKIKKKDYELTKGIPQERAIFEAEKEAKNKLLEEISGDLSVRTNWLETKMLELRDAKEKLEKFFNRKLPNIII